MESLSSTRPLAESFKSVYSNPEHIDYAVIDTFTNSAFSGNPAAVILLPEFRDTKWMQSVAAEFSLPVTCFLVRKDTKLVEGDKVTPEDELPSKKLEVTTSFDSKTEASEDSDMTEKETNASASETDLKHVIHEYDIRWYTQFSEADLCGHATLAASYLLYETGLIGKKDTIFFHTKSGLLSVRTVGPKDSDAQSSSADGRKLPTEDMIELNFPWVTTTPSPFSSVEKLTQTLKNVEVVAVSKASHKLIIELASREDLDKLSPNMQELLSCDSDALFATAPGGPVSEFDFASRCFFPKVGLDEDPVCGSAHCALGPYWSTKLGKDNLLAYQASKRGGILGLQVDKKIGRVYIRGQATMVMAGVLVK
ncbi:trans-2,3-dihydro-3-hydroxyanthranilate isomerase [Marchantia polymorpha subsp. ruderalis]|nr:hypothetical protein MARPO_0011s0056 [Marchantia polymorpha]BBN08332.1 hypothetical protein Mp_4g10700 [Marchantia polymorpha subsp. ruderalis]|eukprot:PTQ46368.1 hypothetical protein MARPO_0011s0056 [Marchantia polymorpha]